MRIKLATSVQARRLESVLGIGHDEASRYAALVRELEGIEDATDQLIGIARAVHRVELCARPVVERTDVPLIWWMGWGRRVATDHWHPLGPGDTYPKAIQAAYGKITWLFLDPPADGGHTDSG
jgi:hypothetical protein